MAKGSQLSQLKSALSQAGLNRPLQGRKKRKRAGTGDQDKDKQAAKLEDIHRKLNAFDLKVTQLKHDVGGRKLKGVSGRPAQSKQAGLEQREKTLLKEYEERDRAGGIVDRRFGENDPTMTPEERMLERFTRERQRASKSSVFNLGDEVELTHYGQSLSNLDDFDDVDLGLDDEEDELGQIDKDIVKRSHFGGFDEEEEDPDQPARKKSKSEVMAEVMAKSKEHKLLRQLEREHGENIRHELDQEFDALRSLLFAPDPSATGSNSVPLGSKDPDSNPPNQSTQKWTDTYDQNVRELAFDKRAKAKDRTKTEEELAIEEKDALEKAERRRQRRMLGQDEDESDEDLGKGRGKRKRERGADDLEDDYHSDRAEWDGLGAGLEGFPAEDSESLETSESESGEEDDDEESKSSGSDIDEDGDEAESEPSEVEEGDHENLVSTAEKPIPQTRPAKELPYTFPCPSSHEEFLEIVIEVADEDVPTVVQRIRALHHPSLDPTNKLKLQTLVTVLIDHILYITSPPSPRFNLVSSLLPHIFALTQSYPIPSAEYFVQKLCLMHKNLKRGLSRGALDVNAKTWPGVAELSFLRVIAVIWPTSDMNHPVISPARLLMGAYLGLGRVRSLRDIASGMFLCTLFLQFEELSKRLVPEAINFLINAVLHIAPHEYKDAASLPGSFPSPDFRTTLCSSLSLDAKKARDLQAVKPNLVDVLSTDNADEQAKVDLLGLAFDLLGQFADMYKSLDGFIELYESLHKILLEVDHEKLPASLKTRLGASSETIGRLLKFSKRSRRPLFLQAHKPIPIPTYIPKFEISSSSYFRNQDPDRERKEAAKLRNQVKQERKGAIRELRKDARFLAVVQQRKQIQKDQEYNARMKRVMGSLESERAEQKALEREKSKAKKRARGK